VLLRGSQLLENSFLPCGIENGQLLQYGHAHQLSIKTIGENVMYRHPNWGVVMMQSRIVGWYGPKFNQKTLDILLRFRLYNIPFTADIEKAFLMVSIAEQVRDVLRFLWFDNVLLDKPIVIELRFTCVVFG
jgi:hypothetical protein